MCRSVLMLFCQLPDGRLALAVTMELFYFIPANLQFILRDVSIFRYTCIGRSIRETWLILIYRSIDSLFYIAFELSANSFTLSVFPLASVSLVSLFMEVSKQMNMSTYTTNRYINYTNHWLEIIRFVSGCTMVACRHSGNFHCC